MYGYYFGGVPTSNPSEVMHAHHQAARATSRAEWLARDVEWLEHRIDKLVLANVALFSLLEDRGEVTERELLDRIREIDLRDGKRDGKISSPIANCPSCGRTMSRRHNRCLYCGAEDLESHPFG